MKKYLYSPVLVALAIICTMISCTENFEELNTPPTSVTKIDPALVFSNVQKTMMYDNSNDYWKLNTMLYGAWVQHWGVWDHNFAPPYYVPTFAWHDTDWERHYEQLKELSQTEKLLLNSVEDGNRNSPEIRSKLAAVMIMHVFVAERLTASVGDIPYFEAVQGLSGNVTPAYDTQEEIYPALLDTLDKYIGKLTPGDLTFGEADFFYGGDVAMWKKFGNSLKLRIGMRLKYADPALAEAVVTEAMNSPLISSNAESATIPTTSGGGPDAQAHPILAIYRQPAGKSMLGETLINMLKAKNDPRLTLIAEPTANSKAVFENTGDTNDLEYRGLPHGMTVEEADQIIVGDYSYPSSSIFVNENVERPMKVLMYSEVAFLQAEAALAGWGATPAEAEGYYRAAIEADLSKFPYEVPQNEIDAYLVSEGTLSGTPEQQLEQIMTQKWLALFDQERQAYLNWRRTGYPQLDPGSAQGLTGGIIPRRGLYHQQEQSLNAANYNAAIKSQGPDTYTTRIWIDAKN